MCKDGKGLNPLVPILQGHWPHPGFSRKHIWPSFPSEAWSRAGQRPLISKLEFALFWTGFSTIHSCPQKGQYCPFSTLDSNLGPFQGAPWERGQDGRIGGTVGSGLRVDVGSRSCILGYVHCLRAGWAVWLLLPSQPLGCCVSVFRRQSTEIFGCCEFCVSHRVPNSGVA